MRRSVSDVWRERQPPETPAPLRVLCVEDLRWVAEAIRDLVDREAGLECVGILAAPDDLAREAVRLKADIVLLDLYFGGHDGEVAFRAMRALLDAAPHVRVIIVTGDNHPQMVQRAFDLGARGYIVKDAPRALIEAIRAVGGGEAPRPFDR